MRRVLSILFGLALVLALAMVPTQIALGDGTSVCVTNLDPSWTATGGGGVYSAYIGPPPDLASGHTYYDPGDTAVYLGREAGIIKAGLNVDTDGNYWDEGLFGFRDNLGTINTLAAGTLSYDVVNQYGTNPVWMTIEIDTGVVGTRTDNTAFQHVPTTNPASWHTVNAAAGLWLQWTTYTSGVTIGSPLTLSQIASNATYTGLNMTRVYLRLGMGNSYGPAPNGTQGWVDKVTIGTVTYDFVVAGMKSVTPTAGPPGTANFTTGDGNVVDLTAVSPPAIPPVTLPYGMFEFKICCMTGSTATLNLTLPGPVPAGYKWWKYVGGSWYSLPIGSNDGDNFITVTLRDNVLPDDEDSIAGQITDQGGPGEPGAVGWETYPVSKVGVLLPWIVLLAAIAAGASLLVLRHRQTKT
jgi:hypothetical protein